MTITAHDIFAWLLIIFGAIGAFLPFFTGVTPPESRFGRSFWLCLCFIALGFYYLIK